MVILVPGSIPPGQEDLGASLTGTQMTMTDPTLALLLSFSRGSQGARMMAPVVLPFHSHHHGTKPEDIRLHYILFPTLPIHSIS